MHHAAAKIVDHFFPCRSFIAAAENSRHGAFFADPQVGSSFGGAEIDDTVLIFSHGSSVVMALRPHCFPMSAMIETAERCFPAGEKNHPGICLAGKDLVDVHIGESFIC